MMRLWMGDLERIRVALADISELPILLLWGAMDVAVRPRSAYELQKRLQNSTVLMMEGIGHMPYEEVPDEFSRIVLDFFLHDRPSTPLQSSRQELSDSGHSVDTVSSQMNSRP
jgi:pimeloyl-ACP methyl ester carboxylesterase